MPIIHIQNLDNLKLSTDNNAIHVLDIILGNYVDWMHACGAKGKCTTCKMTVLEGGENLSPVSPAEEKFMALNRLKPGERLSCQCTLHGDIVIKVPESSKLPHIKYTG